MLSTRVRNKLIHGFKLLAVFLIILSIFVSSIYSALEVLADNSGQIICYVAVDGIWKEVKTITTTTHESFSGKDRWYVTAKELEDVYGEYGFSNDSYNGERYFIHTTKSDSNRIWCDTASVEDSDNDTYKVPIESSEVSLLYYVPNNTKESDWVAPTDTTYAKNNSFYSITFRDALNKVPTDKLPEDSYLLKGKSTEITLPYIDGVTYYAYNETASPEEKLDYTQTIDKDNGTVTISVENISSPVYITDSEDIGTAEFYVLVNNEWTNLGSYALGNAKTTFDVTGDQRFYVTSAQLLEIYGENFGLQSSDITTDSHIFAYNDDFYQEDDTKHELIWSSVSPQNLTTTVDGVSTTDTVLPISSRLHSRVYYLPNNKSGASSYFTESKSFNDTQLKTDNSFYSITVTDLGNLVAEDDKSKFPDTEYILSGTEKTMTLPALAKDGEKEGRYIVKNALTGKSVKNISVTKNEDGTFAIDFNSISCPVLITTKSVKLQVTYTASVKSSLVNRDGYLNSSVTIESDATINGGSTYSEYVTTNKYTFLAPSTEVVTTVGDTKGLGKRVFYTFDGWKLGDDDTLYKAGEEIDQSVLLAYTDDEGNVDISPAWDAYDEKGRWANCNFFVNLNCEIMDNESNGFNGQPTNNFTSCVYSSRVLTTSTKDFSASQDTQITASQTSENAYEIDSKIREITKTEIGGVLLEDFPTNEEVLRKIRESSTKIYYDTEGTNEINHSDITSENFTIRWYVLKYHKDDGYHIDGVLVAKKARFVVKKTFVGDEQAIEEVKNNFYITVNHDNDGTAKEDYKLSLNAKDDETDSTYTGYTSYDADTDTYVWELDARQSTTYNIKEHNYALDQTKWNNTNRYKVENSDDVTEANWNNYTDDGIELEAESYGTDVPQTAIKTASLQNVYVRSGILTVTKIDSSTYHGMKNVKFKLSRADGEKLTLYKKADKNEYSTDTTAPNNGYTEIVSDNVIETDLNGFFNVRLAIYNATETRAQYYLEEEIPVGYEGAKKILVTVSDNGTVEMAQEVVESTVQASDWLDGVDTTTLTIKNKSKLLTTVKAQKDWGDASDSEKQPVTVQLWKNGAKVTGDSYTKTLNADNDWTWEWLNLPLYEDGDPVQYTLREISIGNTSYDADADTDGYSEYVVTYDNTLYRIDNGDYTNDPTWLDSTGERKFANNALLVVHNRLLKGKIGFAKVDDAGKALQGAEFTLYSDRECTAAIETAVADKSGFVSFSEQAQGTYYMKETVVPTNYFPNDTLYVVAVKRGKVIITADGSDDEITQIVNYYKLKNLEFSFIKTDEDNNPLGNAKFGLYKLTCTDDTHDHSKELLVVTSTGQLTDSYTTCWEEVSTSTSSTKTGIVKFSGLRGNDTYRLVEYGIPAGYKSPSGQWAITYGDDNKTEFNIVAVYDESKESKPPAFEKIDNSTVSFRLKNYKLDDLPTAGNVGIYKYLATGATLLTVGGALFLLNKKRNSAPTNNEDGLE